MRCKERAAWLTRHVCTGSTMRFKDDQALPVDLRGGERSEENKSDVRGPRQPWKVSATPPPHPIGQSSGDFFLFHSGWVICRIRLCHGADGSERRRGGKIDRVTRAPGLFSRAPCRITTQVNQGPILMDTHPRRTPRHPDLTHLTPTLQPLSLGTAQRGRTTHTYPHSTARPQPQRSLELRRLTVQLRALPIEELASRPPTHPQAMLTR